MLACPPRTRVGHALSAVRRTPYTRASGGRHRTHGTAAVPHLVATSFCNAGVTFMHAPATLWALTGMTLSTLSSTPHVVFRQQGQTAAGVTRRMLAAAGRALASLLLALVVPAAMGMARVMLTGEACACRFRCA